MSLKQTEQKYQRLI